MFPHHSDQMFFGGYTVSASDVFRWLSFCSKSFHTLPLLPCSTELASCLTTAHHPTNPDDFAAVSKSVLGKVLSRYSLLPSGQTPALWLAPGNQSEWSEWGKCYLVTPFFPLRLSPEVSHQHLRLMSAPGKSADRPSSSHHQLSKWQRCREEKKTAQKYSLQALFQWVARLLSLCQN